MVNTDVPLYGFSHTHLSGTGATDLGDILVLPYADMANTQLNSFDKANEEASAGYYKTKLNNLFTADPNGGEAHQDMTGYIGQYIHGNEPSHHIIYLYNRAEESYKAQEYLDQVYDQFYKPTSDGIIGNEDVGQMSAWYLMSALGFYQISPTDPAYSIGRPIFDKATVDIGSGTFTVTAENNADDNMYIKSVTINGKALDNGFFFDHPEFKPGGELHFVMTGEQS